MAMNGHTPVDDFTLQKLQIVNDEKQFTSELSAQIERWGLRDAGFDYNVVAVFGSQSTGKSTLLNRLFGATFDVMNESSRQQTTKGIWMCRGQGMNVMVMDVEGTDGRERGEDQDFERKSALFSLASSEVLLINLWEHQIGLYQGANMGLLKTVFEVNLGLFGKPSSDMTAGRTLLLFVIRDHLGVTPLSNLSRTLQADITKIWDSISKPQDLQDRKLEDYFDLAFTALPHKILAADKFEEGVADLRKRFIDKENPDFVLKPVYHKRIPADGVAHYMEGIWEQIQNNKDLDLPTQQELLAQFRCDEIAKSALEQFSVQARSQKRTIEAGNVVDGLGEMMRSWKDQALAQFDREASRYHKAVYRKKRGDLIGQINSILSPLFLGQLKNLHKFVLVKFKEELKEGVRAENYNYGEVVSQARERLQNRFKQGVQALTKIREEGDSEEEWNWHEEEELLKVEVEAVATQMRSDETKKMLNLMERTVRKSISDPVELYLGAAAPDMWDSVFNSFRDILGKAEESYLTKAKSFNCTDEENDLALAVLRRRAWLALRSKIDEQTADTTLIGKLRVRFEDKFRYDENGVPRVWRPGDDIDTAFRLARDKTLELIPLYASMIPQNPDVKFTLPSEPASSLSGEDEFDFPSTLQVLSPTKMADITTKFRRDADAFFVEAKRSTVSSVAQIPVWMYAVLVVLGWNEAMAVLFNPLYFVLVIGALGVAYIIFQLNLAGPLYQVTLTVTDEIRRQIAKRLREHFSEPILAPPRPEPSSRQNETVDEDFIR